MCFAGTVVASWSLLQEVAGLNPFTVMTNIFVTEFAEFSETFRKNSILQTEILHRQKPIWLKLKHKIARYVKFANVGNFGKTRMHTETCE